MDPIKNNPPANPPVIVTLIIKGLASRSILAKLYPQEAELALNLLIYLRQKKIPLASSCLGEGICKLCRINRQILSCQITVQEFIQQQMSCSSAGSGSGSSDIAIEIDYL